MYQDSLNVRIYSIKASSKLKKGVVFYNEKNSFILTHYTFNYTSFYGRPLSQYLVRKEGQLIKNGELIGQLNMSTNAERFENYVDVKTNQSHSFNNVN